MHGSQKRVTLVMGPKKNPHVETQVRAASDTLLIDMHDWMHENFALVVAQHRNFADSHARRLLSAVDEAVEQFLAATERTMDMYDAAKLRFWRNDVLRASNVAMR